MSKLIKNGKLISSDNELISGDIWIEDGIIQGIASSFDSLPVTFDEVYDVKGALVTPGLIDVHVHLREPGFTHKETIKSGSEAAARGGFTTICAMPNLNPTPDSAKVMDNIIEKIKKDAIVNVLQYAPITKGLRSEELVDFDLLKASGAFAFTNDGVGVQTAGTMYLAMEKAKAINMPIVAHTEDESLLFGGVMHRGKKSDELNLPGIMSATESSQIARDVLLAEETGVHYHVCHVSTKESVRVIREAKKAGVHVTAEVCPHHLILNDMDIPGDIGNYKMNPPLRAEEDRLALIDGLLDGTIDVIATDHAPHSEEEKRQSMLQAPFGITGSETAFPLLFTEFVRTGIFTLQQVIEWLTIKPAQLFGLHTGKLEIGKTADISVFDLETTYSICADDFASKSKNTPFIGKEVKGQTLYTFVNGKLVYQRGE